MAQVKPQHYWRQLRSVLTAGQWDASMPAKDYHGRLVSWSDLLRKFHKHCPGHNEVAELASQTQALSLLLSANAEGLDGNEPGEYGVLVLEEECLLAEERIEEAMTGYNTLKQLDASRSDSIKAALAYYAYALRRPSDCLDHLAQVIDLANAQQDLAPGSSTLTVTLDAPESSSKSSLSSSWTGSFLSTSANPSIADINDGRAWCAVECIRSICIKGMSYEKLHPDEPEQALSTYLLASPIIAGAVSEIPTSVPTTSVAALAGPEGSSFALYRELWRWTERVLRRAIVLGARLFNVVRTDGTNASLWRLFEQYHACSAHWPPHFRPEHRGTVAVLHLRALILRARAAPTPKPGVDRSHHWISTARSVVQEYRAILSASTTFPKAGERNTKVEDLVDFSVAAWEADGAVGEFAGWVIDVLWWATRLTFNSYRIFRHMSRLFNVGGDPELAKRTLRLYVQIVSKAKQTKLAEDLDTNPEDEGEFGEGKDTDSNVNWVQTLVQGSRMLSRLALVNDDPVKAAEEAREAGEMIEKAKTRLSMDDKPVLAAVLLAEAIWHIASSYTEQDPRSRTAHLEEAMALLKSSLETHPTASVHHHLALANLRPGASHDLQEAILHARAAVEIDSGEMRHWHLLGLLLTASGDWRAAKEVLEMGASVGEAELADEDADSQIDGLPSNDSALEVVQLSAPPSPSKANGAPNGQTNGYFAPLLAKHSVELPPPATLLQPTGDRPPSNRQEAFEHALQLRMTQLTLTEFVKGPEGTGEEWIEVFQWFSERREVGVDDRRRSIDSRRPSQEIRPTSMFSGVERRGISPNPGMAAPPGFSTVEEEGKIEPHHTPDAVPVMQVTPASPMHSTPMFSQDQLNGSTSPVEKSEKSRLSIDTARGKPGKKVREAFLTGVTKSQMRVTTISKKIRHNVVRHNSTHLKRSNSAPDIHALLGQSPYQASSIHLRQHISIYASQLDVTSAEAPPPPPSLPPPEPVTSTPRPKSRVIKDRRLLSNLWLMSSATFRRLGKIEQARGAIQEAEVRDENNPAVWVQLGLYHLALDDDQLALECFQKALFVAPNDVSATIHLCRVYLAAAQAHNPQTKDDLPPADRDNVDLAVGLLSALTRGGGWDVPEAWYFLGKMYGLQGRRDRERECLCFALTLSEDRPLRDPGAAVGWCL
ncbi:uncharacterized protein BXZ73DRAFT_46077 [Epithele typhae]|uniref:uncharacterized protein n=1 Tax=Epithele typhae TaxID=378194 RepID=UPI0020076EC5|nr:uncharacterized protein BXZ73DRAFT_46077 [Epithele typhae]KAH9933971.1 hypothetical protein BXZ73DRAFT_46077 [Epithele typhae]